MEWRELWQRWFYIGQLFSSQNTEKNIRQNPGIRPNLWIPVLRQPNLEILRLKKRAVIGFFSRELHYVSNLYSTSGPKISQNVSYTQKGTMEAP